MRGADEPAQQTALVNAVREAADAASTGEALKFFAWSYAKGADMAKDLDYVPMPVNVVGDIQKMWASEIKDSGGKPLFTLTH